MSLYDDRIERYMRDPVGAKIISRCTELGIPLRTAKGIPYKLSTLRSMCLKRKIADKGAVLRGSRPRREVIYSI